MKKTGVILLSLVVIYTLVGFFALPALLKMVLTNQLAASLGRKVEIGNVSMNPYVLSMTIRNLRISEAKLPGVFASFDELYLNLQATSLIKRGLILKQVTLAGPRLTITRSAPGRFNFSDLLTGSPVEIPVNRFSLNNIQILGGRVLFRDLPQQQTQNFENIKLGIPFISNMHDYVEIWVKPHFSAVINGSPFSFAGESKPFFRTRATELNIHLHDIKIAHYLVYVPSPTHFTLPKGLLDLDLKFSYEQPREGPEMKVSGEIGLKKLQALDEQGNPFLDIPELKIGISSFSPLKHSLHLSRIASRKGTLQMVRAENGSINLQGLLAASGKRKKKTTAGGKLQIRIDSTTLSDFTIQVRDRTLPQPAVLKIDRLKLHLEDITTAGKSPGRVSLSCRVDQSGTAAAEGKFGLSPAFAHLKITLQDFAVPAVQPYIQKRLKAIVTGGRLSLQGNLLASRTLKGPVVLNYGGSGSLDDFSSVSGGKNLVSWKSLAANGIDFSNHPAHFTINGLRLTQPSALVRINPDGTLNILDALKSSSVIAPEAAGRKSGKAAGDSPPPEAAGKDGKGGTAHGPTFGRIDIDKVELQAGRVKLDDAQIKPSFHSTLDGLDGKILGLSSEPGAEAAIKIKGKMNGVAPLAITGKMTPLRENFRFDMALNLLGLDMTSLDPIARKYVGYTLEKGDLSLKLKYNVIETRLDSQNELLLDQLTLGKKVESPQALSMPIKLALRLLKNRQGEIKLDIPVSGDLADPQFHIGSIIWDTFKGIISKAVTSPFSFLASLVNWRGGELSAIEFPYGTSHLRPEATAKLTHLAEALYERPDLELDVKGYVAPSRDREALQQQRFKVLLRRQKLRELARTGKSSISLNQVKIGPNEYEKYLAAAYQETLANRTGKQVGEVLGVVPPEQMKNFLMATIRITRQDLRFLAQQRAIRIRKFILTQGKIEPNRVFIVTPESLSPPKKKGLRGSRAILEVR
ncbi:MAG: DUF748 domain-containing protein [Deltaproteobacteria bacterium]